MTVSQEGGYDPAFFSQLLAAEDRHFWFRSRNRLICRVVADAVAGIARPRVLEVGCGSGNVLRALAKINPVAFVTGMDLYGSALAFAQKRTGCALVQGDVRCAPFSGGFDAVGIFDVLEHLPDDDAVLKNLRALLRPGGTLVVTVPARKSLWSWFDDMARHCRRYEMHELVSKLSGAGFRMEFASYFMLTTYPLMAFSRRKRGPRNDSERAACVQGELRVIPVVNGLLTAALSIEAAWVGRRGRLPMGSTIVAAARA